MELKFSNFKTYAKNVINKNIGKNRERYYIDYFKHNCNYINWKTRSFAQAQRIISETDKFRQYNTSNECK